MPCSSAQRGETYWGGGRKLDHGSDVSILSPRKTPVFHFLSLHHPNNRLENISVFYFSLKSIAQKTLFLGRKILEGHLTPSYACAPACLIFLDLITGRIFGQEYRA
jgi:hypothetical protein